VGTDRSTKIGDNCSTDVGKDQNLKVGKNLTTQVGDDETRKVGKNLVIDVGDEVVIKCGSASITMKKDGTINIQGKDISLNGSGKINATADSDIVMKGSKILQN
jgi:type VI secretion system secreted protein VgrG